MYVHSGELYHHNVNVSQPRHRPHAQVVLSRRSSSERSLTWSGSRSARRARWLSPFLTTTQSASCSRGSGSRETLKRTESPTVTMITTACWWSRSTTITPTQTPTRSVSLYPLSSWSTAPTCRLTRPPQEEGVQVAWLHLQKRWSSLRRRREAANRRPGSLYQCLVLIVRGSAVL